MPTPRRFFLLRFGDAGSESTRIDGSCLLAVVSEALEHRRWFPRFRAGRVRRKPSTGSASFATSPAVFTKDNTISCRALTAPEDGVTAVMAATGLALFISIKNTKRLVGVDVRAHVGAPRALSLTRIRDLDELEVGLWLPKAMRQGDGCQEHYDCASFTHTGASFKYCSSLLSNNVQSHDACNAFYNRYLLFPQVIGPYYCDAFTTLRPFGLWRKIMPVTGGVIRSLVTRCHAQSNHHEIFTFGLGSFGRTGGDAP